jgi:hypothetical protein
VAAHLSSRHKKWPAIFCNCYLYGPVPKITILMSAHLRGRYQKACQSLVSIVLRQPLLIIYYWYRLVSPPILVSTTVTRWYQYWIQGVTIDHFSSSGILARTLANCVLRVRLTRTYLDQKFLGYLKSLQIVVTMFISYQSFSIVFCLWLL